MIAVGGVSGERDKGAIFVSQLRLKSPLVKISVDAENVQFLAISPDKKLVAAVSGDYRGTTRENWQTHLRSWTIADGKLVFDHPFPRLATYGAIQFSGDAKTIYMLDETVVRLFEIAKRSFTSSFKYENSQSDEFDVSQDGKWIVIPGRGENAVNVIDAQSNQVFRAFATRQPQGIVSCKISPNGRWIAAVDRKQFVHVWNIEKPDVESHKWRHSPPIPYIFSPDSKAIMIAQYQQLLVYDLENGERILKGKIPESFGEMVFPRFDPDSKKLWVAGSYPESTMFEIPE